MITRFKLFEYTGPYKAVGFKHYQEEGFRLIVKTTKENIEKFVEIFTTFKTYIENLDFKSDIFIDEITSSIMLTFPAVNKYEAFSIIEQIKIYFDENDIKIDDAIMTMIDDNQPGEEEINKAINVTRYLNRKEELKKMVPAISNFMDNAYKTSKIGF